MNSRPLRVDGGGLPYLLKLPDRPESAPHPVLFFLHGYDEGAPMPMEDALTLHGPLRTGNPGAALAPFIIVAPQMPVRGDIWHRYANGVRAILTNVLEQHGGDAQRAYITGFSFGGNGVFDLALLQPNTWAALWAVDPTRVPERDPNAAVWLSFGEVARYRKRGFIQALGLEPAAQTTAAPRVYLDEGEDHVGSARLAYRDDRIYAWLLAQRLGGP
ncbi:MAG TPA: hypothetical protein VK993_08475 [Chthoniobacterales bacterium]|nr:hypothetical protein [Chthoniobacterales bacterium]